ncbi:MAG: hypothetical protein JXR76_32505 [Deltaproteobacteria bacterium]|nr:hypothetical protein [Deltaproteobacteria bacterium]
MKIADAEIGAMEQSRRAGNKGGKGVLMVQGKPICPYCQSDIKKMALTLELDSLEIHHLDTGEVAVLWGKDFINLPEGKKLKDLMPKSCQ